MKDFTGNPIFLSLLLAIAMQSEATDEAVMNILRPKPQGEQVSPAYVEINYMILDVRHPNGIEWFEIFKEVSKIGRPEKRFNESDRHKSGYFIYKRRFKSPAIQKYHLRVKPIGADPIVSEVLPIEYRDNIPDYLGFVNLSEGDVIEANDPSDADALTYVYLDCMHSCGIRGDGNFREAQHVGYKDEDGIDWVELVMDGPDGKAVVRNETALIFDKDLTYHGRYWGEPVDPTQTKPPEQPWPDEVEWKPIEGFGLYEFAISLTPGNYTLRIRAKNNDGKIIEGPTITVKQL